jgi:hypothetical protein
MEFVLGFTLRYRAAPTRAASALTLALVALAVPVHAQDTGRYTVRATISGTAVYDDNIYFEREDQEGGAVMRFRPAMSGAYRVSRDLWLDASYTFDADYFPSQPDLNNPFASQGASLGGRYQLGPRTTVNVGAQYSTSDTAGDLIGGSGLELGRVQGTAWGFSAGGSRRISKAGTLGLGWTVQTVSYDGNADLRAHSVLLNWSQQITSRTGLSLSAGPRFSEVGTSTEAQASIQHRIEHGSLSLGYGRSRYPAPGRDVDGESLSGTVQLMLSPTVQITATPGLSRYRFGAADVGGGRTWRMVLSTSWQISPALSARAIYQHVGQDGRPVQGAFPRGPWISRNVFALSFSAGVGRPRDTRVNPGTPPVKQGSTR